MIVFVSINIILQDLKSQCSAEQNLELEQERTRVIVINCNQREFHSIAAIEHLCSSRCFIVQNLSICFGKDQKMLVQCSAHKFGLNCCNKKLKPKQVWNWWVLAQWCCYCDSDPPVFLHCYHNTGFVLLISHLFTGALSHYNTASSSLMIRL